MTTAPVPRLIRGLAVPTIISMLVTSFYVMADTYFVGKINTQSTAAVGISFSIMAIIQAFGFFCGHGSGNFISRRLGARDYRSAEKMAATGFFSAFLIGCAIALVGLLFLDPICRALGSTPTILPYAKTYLGIILLGAPFMASSLVLNNQMRFQGNAVYAMIGIIVGAVLNIGLDPLLIFVFDMGIAGAAWSTFISQVCSFTILLFMDRKGENIRIHYRHFTPTPAYLKEIVYGGSPSLCRQGLASVSTILLNVAAGNFGDAAIAGMSIVTRICHRFRTGISAGMRIQLRSRIKPPCPTGILVLCESRRYLLSHLLPHRLHLCPGSSFLVPKRRPASYRRRSRSLALAAHYTPIRSLGDTM